MRVYFMGDKAAHMAYAHCLPHVAFYGLHFGLLCVAFFSLLLLFSSAATHKINFQRYGVGSRGCCTAEREVGSVG